MTGTTRLADRGLLEAPPLAELLAALDEGGEEARINGGAVRDALLGEPVGDVDVSTTAAPEIVAARAAARGWKVIPTGVEHGTVTVVVSGRPFEVTTLRRDVSTDGRRATVAFTRDWAEDAGRRDLTINGLFLDRDGVVHDHVGGVADLEARRIRFIGDARTRIREDYLRTLRFFRFHARFAQGAPDADGFSAAIAERAGLATLSAERIRTELLKLLVARRAADTLREMAAAGVIEALAVGVPRLSRFAALARLDEAAPDDILRLSALLQFTAEDARRLRRRLRLSNPQGRRLEAIGDAAPRLDPSDGEAAAKRALHALGAGAFRDRARLAFADAGAGQGDADWALLVALPDRWTPPKPPVSAADFLSRGVPAGPAMGRALRAFEGAWVAAGFPEGPEDVDALVDEVLAGERHPGRSDTEGWDRRT